MEDISNKLFYCKNKDTYPPFKNGMYMEEYFLHYMKINNIVTQRKYIPSLWTNFQIEHWFLYEKHKMQQDLNKWVINNPSPNGYFAVVQHDDGILLNLPDNTIVYGACNGNIPLPLIYQDINNTLINLSKKSFIEKKILCSFIGNITHNIMSGTNVRMFIFEQLSNNVNFKIINSGGWTATVNQTLQNLFIETTINSKFALAPRGYGRSSFRFFECFLLGTIPIYVWNDFNWLPFQDIIDYNKLCIVIHVSELHILENILLSVTESKYENMWKYYYTINHLFELNGMTEQIIRYEM